MAPVKTKTKPGMRTVPSHPFRPEIREASSVPPKETAHPIGLRQERPGRPICVLIADDHELVRRGLRALLAAEPELFEVCAEAATGHEAVQKARQFRPDVVVLDVLMPGLNGLEATRMIVKEAPHTEVLILTIHESEQMIEELLRAGARGYLLKSDVSRDLPVAIESLHAKRPFFSSRIAQKVLEAYLRDSTPGCNSQLTPTERRVIQLLAEGKSNKEVASIEEIAVNTAEAHRANIMRKLKLRSMSDLVHYAVRNEIIEP
ncbi:MAG TPA: response regulator transcription factor [Terriglobia bacterium]|nr:response regulator transcription factor [Terriglobia bacterium]